MGLSRRTFTKEFKLAAVRRLEQGVSIPEVGAGWKSTPTCCTAGGGRFRRGRRASTPHKSLGFIKNAPAHEFWAWRNAVRRSIF
jgi:transposase-like protein